MKHDISQFQGCLLGGAIGDALGYPIEFMSLQEIRHRYPPDGIQTIPHEANDKAKFSDDTQMTIFTAEGLLRAISRQHVKGICHVPSVVHNAYIRWLHTQGLSAKGRQLVISKLDGWIVRQKDLYFKRAPGNICLSALSAGSMGTVTAPINQSKGCGGVMRAAPVGLLYDKEEAFEIACEIAAITHGHPGGYIPAGALAYMISGLIEGLSLWQCIHGAIKMTSSTPGGDECTTLMKRAMKLYEQGNPSSEKIGVLGEGWTGEEALGIAVYSALSYENDFKRALILSVNHNGDSDSTGAITGNLLGASLGRFSISEPWIEEIELKEVLITLANDIYTQTPESSEWIEKYPPW